MSLKEVMQQSYDRTERAHSLKNSNKSLVGIFFPLLNIKVFV